jgi:hypothetical protein
MHTTQQVLEDHFRSEVPSDWFDAPVTVLADSEEIVVIGSLPAGRPVDAFREETRHDRMAIAAKAEVKFRRKVTWGVEQEGQRTLFTSASVPVTTRLRFFERAVLDTLVEGGVARSRADALAWCVKLVARHQGEWLDDLRQAISSVEQVRQEGPSLL